MDLVGKKCFMYWPHFFHKVSILSIIVRTKSDCLNKKKIIETLYSEITQTKINQERLNHLYIFDVMLRRTENI